MAVTFGFYNSMNGDRKYNAQDMSRIFNGIINDGIFMSIGTSMIVKATEGMIVEVGEGRAWFNGTWTHNDAILELRLTESDLLMDRIDAVVLEIDTNDNVRTNSIKVVTGEPSMVPNQPVMRKESGCFQYPLAYIYVAGTVTEITQANITNMVGTSECPFVTGILETMDIDALIAQWGQQWNEWKSSIEADNDNWTDTERAEYEQWVSDQEDAMDAWTATFKKDLTDFKTLNESDFLIWFDGIKKQLTEDAVGNLQTQMSDIAQREFERFYGMANKTTVVNKTNGVTMNIVETTDEAVSTTVFATSDTGGKLITTTCVPTSGNYDYVKTVSIENLESGIRIVETFATVAK
jgi:hypothetical protein